MIKAFLNTLFLFLSLFTPVTQAAAPYPPYPKEFVSIEKIEAEILQAAEQGDSKQLETLLEKNAKNPSMKAYKKAFRWGAFRSNILIAAIKVRSVPCVDILLQENNVTFSYQAIDSSLFEATLIADNDITDKLLALEQCYPKLFTHQLKIDFLTHALLACGVQYDIDQETTTRHIHPRLIGYQRELAINMGQRTAFFDLYMNQLMPTDHNNLTALLSCVMTKAYILSPEAFAMIYKLFHTTLGIEISDEGIPEFPAFVPPAFDGYESE